MGLISDKNTVDQYTLFGLELILSPKGQTRGNEDDITVRNMSLKIA